LIPKQISKISLSISSIISSYFFILSLINFCHSILVFSHCGFMPKAVERVKQRLDPLIFHLTAGFLKCERHAVLFVSAPHLCWTAGSLEDVNILATVHFFTVLQKSAPEPIDQCQARRVFSVNATNDPMH
jgi:hypothetical protein